MTILSIVHSRPDPNSILLQPVSESPVSVCPVCPVHASSPHRPLKQNKTVVASGRPSQAIPLLGHAKSSEQRLFSSTQLASQLTSASANNTNLSPVLLLVPPATHPDFSFDAVTSFSSYGPSSCICNVVAFIYQGAQMSTADHSPTLHPFHYP